MEELRNNEPIFFDSLNGFTYVKVTQKELIVGEIQMRAKKEKIHCKIRHSRAREVASKIKVFMMKKNGFFYLLVLKGMREAQIYTIMFMDHQQSLYMGTRLLKRVSFQGQKFENLEVQNLIMNQNLDIVLHTKDPNTQKESIFSYSTSDSKIEELFTSKKFDEKKISKILFFQNSEYLLAVSAPNRILVHKIISRSSSEPFDEVVQPHSSEYKILEICTSNLKFDPHIFLVVQSNLQTAELELYNSISFTRIYSEKINISQKKINFFWSLSSFNEDPESINIGKGGFYTFDLYIQKEEKVYPKSFEIENDGFSKLKIKKEDKAIVSIKHPKNTELDFKRVVLVTSKYLWKAAIALDSSNNLQIISFSNQRGNENYELTRQKTTKTSVLELSNSKESSNKYKSTLIPNIFNSSKIEKNQKNQKFEKNSCSSASSNSDSSEIDSSEERRKNRASSSSSNSEKESKKNHQDLKSKFQGKILSTNSQSFSSHITDPQQKLWDELTPPECIKKTDFTHIGDHQEFVDEYQQIFNSAPSKIPQKYQHFNRNEWNDKYPPIKETKSQMKMGYQKGQIIDSYRGRGGNTQIPKFKKYQNQEYKKRKIIRDFDDRGRGGEGYNERDQYCERIPKQKVQNQDYREDEYYGDSEGFYPYQNHGQHSNSYRGRGTLQQRGNYRGGRRGNRYRGR